MAIKPARSETIVRMSGHTHYRDGVEYPCTGGTGCPDHPVKPEVVGNYRDEARTMLGLLEQAYQFTRTLQRCGITLDPGWEGWGLDELHAALGEYLYPDDGPQPYERFGL